MKGKGESHFPSFVGNLLNPFDFADYSFTWSTGSMVEGAQKDGRGLKETLGA